VNDANAKLVASSQRPGSGLDYLQRIISGEYAQLPIGEHLGFRIAAAEPGKVEPGCCDNFLYGFKAAPRGCATRRSGRCCSSGGERPSPPSCRSKAVKLRAA